MSSLQLSKMSAHAFADMNISEDLLKWALIGLNDKAIIEFAKTIDILAESTDLAFILLKLAYTNNRFIHVSLVGTVISVTYNTKVLFTFDNANRMPA